MSHLQEEAWSDHSCGAMVFVTYRRRFS